MKKINLSGTWKLNVMVGDQDGVATFQLVEAEDGILSGTYTGRVGSRAKVSGTVQGPDVEFGFNWHAGRVIYKGRYSSGKLSGTCSYGTVGKGTFEGGRAEEKSRELD